jgi:hypothetical protein
MIEVGMGLLSHIAVTDVFIIFFLTLGPLKAIGPFARVTRGADPALCRSLAWRATPIATVIVLAVVLLGSVNLRNWRVSVPAIVAVMAWLVRENRPASEVMAIVAGEQGHPMAKIADTGRNDPFRTGVE